MKLTKIISGGQTGADRGALKAAKKCDIATGGWMPREYRALDGGHPEFAELYGIQEHDSPLYPPRTLLNVKESGATVRFAGNWQSPGELCTLKAIRQYRKPFFDVSLTIQCGRHLNENLLPFSPENLADWILSNSIVVLNGR